MRRTTQVAARQVSSELPGERSEQGVRDGHVDRQTKQGGKQSDRLAGAPSRMRHGMLLMLLVAVELAWVVSLLYAALRLLA